MTYTRSTNRSSFRNRRYQNAENRHARFPKKRGPRRQEYINPALFVKKGIEPENNVYVPTHAFSDFAISEQIKENIRLHGYQTPTPIQDQAIEYILQGRDVVGMANTGTGKTAAFLIPLIEKAFRDRSQKVLIVAPTRELAVQIEEEFRYFSRQMQLYSALCIGGAGITGQIRTLRRNPQFVIGTPGRLKDLEQQRALSFTSFATIVLDEVDRMLDMGFIQDVRYIISKLSSPRHSLFFSATMPPEVSDVMHTLLKNPITVSVKSGESALYVDQDVVRTSGKQKIDVLHDLLIQDGFEKVLVFGRTKWGMEKLAREMETRGFKVASIHGNKNQSQRQRAIEQFKSNKIQVLLATDIASRGLDIDNVTHVINYDIPETYKDYVHRIGRTGRAGKKGNALTFVE
ncbi:MAG: DEAD/DEAH box helicase [bacterium]|nr:DEAD/DEAH box helicase [bacterium]